MIRNTEQVLAPHTSDLCWFLLLSLVDVGAAFAQVEVHLVSGVTSLQLQQSRMFTLVPQTALIAGEDGLTPQSAHTQTQLIYSIQTESISSSLLPAAQSRNMVHTSLSAPGPAEHTPVCKSALIYVSPTELKCLHELNLRPVLQVTRCQAQLTD